jgi:hypothetical protein
VKKWLIVSGLLAVVLVALAAAEQITREEFDALQKEVTDLRAKVVMLDIRLKPLEKQNLDIRLKALEKEREAAQQVAQQAAQRAADTPLKGTDLVAWKLARARAEEYQSPSTLRRPARAPAAAERGSLEAYSTMVQSSYAALAPPPLEPPAARASSMRKTPEGDYIFTFKRKGGHEAIEVKVLVLDGLLQVDRATEVDLPPAP